MKQIFIHLSLPFLAFLGNADAASIEHNGNSYEIISFETLSAAGWNDGSLFKGPRDLPSIYNGVKIVTLGKVGYSCNLENSYVRWYGERPTDRIDPPGADLKSDKRLAVYWGNVSQNDLKKFATQCSTELKRQNLAGNKPIFAYATFYGTVRNGTGGSAKDCKNTSDTFVNEEIRDCLHFDLDRIDFAGQVITLNQQVNQYVLSYAKASGPALLNIVVQVARKKARI